MTHRVRHRSKHTERRGVHHQVGELEHRFREAFRENQHRPTLYFGNQNESHREEHAEHNNLQHLAFRDGFRNVLRKNIGEELRRGVWRNIQGLRRRGRRQVNAFAGAADMNGRVTDQHRERGNNFKIDERLDAETPDFFQIRVARDANDENAEKQWRDDDFDEAKKNRAENLQVDCDGRPIVAKFSARKKADENPSRQRAARSTVRGDKKDGQPAQKARDQRGQRQDLRAREQRCRNCNRCCGDCRGKKFVFHRHPAKKFIGAERYAG